MLEETGKFLEIYNLPILDQEETDNVNKLIMCSEIEFIIIIIKTFSKVQDQTASQGNSKHIKKN